MGIEQRHFSAEERHSLYFSLFKGGVVRQSALFSQSPEMRPTIDVLIDSGLLQQQVIDEGEDYILTMDQTYYDRKTSQE